MLLKFTVFLVLNFSALALGGLFTGKGVPSDCYAELNKAPWTPPGWVFGAAWTTIMIFFTFFMTYAHRDAKDTKFLLLLFAVQWILNVAWNPTFFYFHQVLFALVLIIALTILIAFMLFRYWPELHLKTFFLLPYLIWLIIASSLNAYVVLKN
jgi:tryptophan-rich sensory protein